jgi:hypothetical protein
MTFLFFAPVIMMILGMAILYSLQSKYHSQLVDYKGDKNDLPEFSINASMTTLGLTVIITTIVLAISAVRFEVIETRKNSSSYQISKEKLAEITGKLEYYQTITMAVSEMLSELTYHMDKDACASKKQLDVIDDWLDSAKYPPSNI